MFLKYLLVLVGLWSFMTRDAYAYLDPGTGSYFVQIVIATLAGGGYLLVSSWDRVKKFLSGLTGSEKNSPSKKNEGRK